MEHWGRSRLQMQRERWDQAAVTYTLDNAAQGRTVGLCADLAWQVAFACENGHGGRFGAIELGERFPRATSLDAIAARLVCSVCASRDGGLWLLQDQGAAQRRNVDRFTGANRQAGSVRS